MSFSSSLAKILGSAAKYSAVAAQAVHEAQAQIGPGNGATKKQAAIAYVLAAAHGGETVDSPTVARVAMAVELAAGIANMLGLFGGAPKTGPVAVPTLEAAATITAGS